MSRSRSSSGLKAGSLAKCYDYFENKKIKKKHAANPSKRSAVADVEEKIEAAKGRVFSGFEEASTAQTTAEQSSPVAGESQHERQVWPIKTDMPTGQSAANDPRSQDSGVGASALATASYVRMDATQKKNLAAALIDPEQLWSHFFSGVVTDDAADAVEENVEEQRLKFTHSMEIKKAVVRSEQRFCGVCHFPLKLVLTPLRRGRKVASAFASMLEMRFGPLHVALQVGNVVLEWNDSSLVAPYLCAYEDQVMELDMQPHSTWVDFTSQQLSEMKKAAESLNYSDQIALTYKVTTEKKDLIDALIALIVDYNKHFYYNLFDRNCQRFVLDALRVLQVSVPKQLPGGLGEYYKALVEGKTPSVPSRFRTHSDLDDYVMHKIRENVIGDMPQHDLEFLLALYFRFHLESKARLKDEGPQALEAWQCGETHCCIGKVEKHIQIESMKIHSFNKYL